MRVFTAAIAVLLALGSVSAQSDLDQLMSEVLSRRDDNWKKLQQYVLEERETFQLAGSGGIRLYGFDRDYSWFVKEGFFVRSPVRADGVTISESERRQAEEEWLTRQRRRDDRRAAREGRTSELTDPAATGSIEDVLKQSFEPEFIQAAYFLKFKFDPGQYAFVGPEDLAGRRVLRIEYYPTKLFSEGRTRPSRRVRKRDEQIEEKLNKSSLVTLWIDPVERQILQYEFHNIDMDFLPLRSLARIDGMDATMRMAQAFPGVWLPQAIALKATVSLAMAAVDARYDVEYHDYKLADVSIRVQ